MGGVECVVRGTGEVEVETEGESFRMIDSNSTGSLNVAEHRQTLFLANVNVWLGLALGRSNVLAGNSDTIVAVRWPRRLTDGIQAHRIVAEDLVHATTVNKMVRMSLSWMGNIQGRDDNRFVPVVSSADSRGQLANQMMLRHKRRVRAFHTTDKG